MSTPSCLRSDVELAIVSQRERIANIERLRFLSAWGAQYPAGGQVDKSVSCWLGKDVRKVQDYGIPCRCESSCTHIGLHEIGVPLSISSAGHFCFYSFS